MIRKHQLTYKYDSLTQEVATFGAPGPNHEKQFANHIKKYTSFFYLRSTDDNTSSLIVSMLGQSNLLKISLSNEKLHTSYFSPNIGANTQEEKMDSACDIHRKKRNAYRISEGHPEGKRAFG